MLLLAYAIRFLANLRLHEEHSGGINWLPHSSEMYGGPGYVPSMVFVFQQHCPLGAYTRFSCLSLLLRMGGR